MASSRVTPAARLLGRHGDGDDRFELDGRLDEVMVFGRRLDGAEIAALVDGEPLVCPGDPDCPPAPVTSRLTVSPNGHHLTRLDGTPFFYLGDTAWWLVQKLDRPDVRRYLDDRAAKGFTVIAEPPGVEVMQSWHGPSKRTTDIPPSAIHAMTALSKTVDDVAFLSWAKPTTGAPPHIREAAAAAVREGRADGYSETKGLQPLREAIVVKLARDNDVAASPDEIILTVGAIEGISAALMAVLDPGDEVILPTPTYSTHINQVLMASGVPVF